MKFVNSLVVSSSSVGIVNKSSSYPIFHSSTPSTATTSSTKFGIIQESSSHHKHTDSINSLQLSQLNLNRIPNFLHFKRSIREMMEWLIGKRGMSVTIRHQPRPLSSSIVPIPSTSSTGQQHQHQQSRSRHGSTEVDDDGCCLVKVFLSNMLTFTTRSRRKIDKENRNPPGSCKKAGVSESQAAVSKVRKAPQSDLCVAESFDDSMLDKFTAIPYGVDKNEWLATHTLALFDNVNALCGTISELCTPVSCPIMSFPGVSKAYFIDERGKRHQYSASQYIDNVMCLCERSRKNEALFPTKFGSHFSSDFEHHCRRMIRLLWHCCGHLYTKHWDHLQILNLRPQCGLVIAHLTWVAKIFALLDPKEYAVLTKTMYLVRPPIIPEPPAKRIGGVDDHGNSTSNDSNIRWNKVPAAKSGSWGGHPTPTVLSCKPYAQTC